MKSMGIKQAEDVHVEILKVSKNFSFHQSRDNFSTIYLTTTVSSKNLTLSPTAQVFWKTYTV